MALQASLHPLVLMNISDHYSRAKANNKNQDTLVIGVLLGTQEGRDIQLHNSYETKFLDENVKF